MFKTANNDSISRPNSRPKLPFPGNGKGNLKCSVEVNSNDDVSKVSTVELEGNVLVSHPPPLELVWAEPHSTQKKRFEYDHDDGFDQ